MKNPKKKATFDVNAFMVLPIKERASYYVAGFVVLPGGTVIVPCLIMYDLWLQMIQMMDKRKRGKHKPSHPAK